MDEEHTIDINPSPYALPPVFEDSIIHCSAPVHLSVNFVPSPDSSTHSSSSVVEQNYGHQWRPFPPDISTVADPDKGKNYLAMINGRMGGKPHANSTEGGKV